MLNLPNALTLLRVLMIPAIVYFLLVPRPRGWLIAFVLFAIATLSDAVDGYLARQRKHETSLGKIADPIADKLLVTAVLLVFVELGQISSVPVIVLLAREFLVTGLRIVLSVQEVVLGAGLWGKLKTLTQIGLVFVLLGQEAFGWGATGELLKTIFLYGAVALALISGVEYFYRCRGMLRRLS